MQKKIYLYQVIIFLLTFGLILFPLLVSKPYVLRVLTMSGIYVILAVSLNFISGLSGQFSLGHGAFYGIGAYSAALVNLNWELPFLASVGLGMIISMLAGVIVGLPAIRLRQVYLAVATLGLGEIVRIVLSNWVEVTRGPMGLPGIPAPQILSWSLTSATEQYYLVLLTALVIVWLLSSLSNGHMGLVLRAIRDNEEAVKTSGVNTFFYKVAAFVIGGGIAGLAGSLYAFISSFISPDNFMFAESITILGMVVVGGLGSIPGSILGAIILSLAPEAFRFLADYRMITVGLLMLAMIIFRPTGLLSEEFVTAFKKLAWNREGIKLNALRDKKVI